MLFAFQIMTAFHCVIRSVAEVVSGVQRVVIMCFMFASYTVTLKLKATALSGQWLR